MAGRRNKPRTSWWSAVLVELAALLAIAGLAAGARPRSADGEPASPAGPAPFVEAAPVHAAAPLDRESQQRAFVQRRLTEDAEALRRLARRVWIAHLDLLTEER